MKKTALALVASAIIGLVSFSAPASAQHHHGGGVVKHSGGSARHHHHMRRPVCHVRAVPSRDRFGHRVVRHVRVCR